MPIRAWPDRTWHCRILLIGAGQQIDPPAQRHQMLAQHRLQLAGMTEGELPQQRCDRRGRVHAVEERHHRAAAQGVDVIDAVRVRAHARDNGDQLRGCVPAPHRSGVMSANHRGVSADGIPSPVRIGFSRVVPELKGFYRRPEQMALTFSMPTVICLLLGSIFTAKLPNSDISTGTVIAASMLAYGILSTSFINLGISIAADRDTGALRRLRGTPTTATSYFIGKIVLVAIVSVAEAVILLAVGVLVFGLRLPTGPFEWFTLAWVFLLGIISCSLLGIFISNLASNAVAAAVITNGPAVGLQFISGTYVPLVVLPTWMLVAGSIFPVKWMAQGFRSVLLSEQMVAFEPAGSWELGRIFLVLAAWSVGGLLACLAVFRWSDKN